MTLSELERNAARILTEARVDSPGLCARVLTARASGMERMKYALSCRDEASLEVQDCLAQLVNRRAKGEPLAYILGQREFYGLNMTVSPATLIPRPETELLVDLALKFMPEAEIIFADLGCGCGCIGAALASERPMWRGIALDNSMAALKLAKGNLAIQGERVSTVAADMFQCALAESSFDLVISNPPYIDPEEKIFVMPETLAYEPHEALFSENGGLARLEAVINVAAICLKRSGMVMLEHGASQGRAVLDLLLAHGFSEVMTHKDMAGLDRCATARKL